MGHRPALPNINNLDYRWSGVRGVQLVLPVSRFLILDEVKIVVWGSGASLSNRVIPRNQIRLT
jgi:hypothetical protein